AGQAAGTEHPDGARYCFARRRSVERGSRPEHPGADAARIRQIIAEEESAWNRGDARAYASHFEEEGGFTNVLGTVYYGRHEFEERHARIFATVFKNTVLSMIVQKIRFIRPDVALVDVDTEMRGIKA